MKKNQWISLASGLLIAACSGTGESSIQNSVGSAESPSTRAAIAGDDEDDDGDDETVDLSAVPDAIKNAALAAVPGLVLTGAERETEGGRVVYSLTGTVDGKEYEVEVAADGTVQEIEAEDDEDDEDDRR